MAELNDPRAVPQENASRAATDDVFIFPASFAQKRLWFLDKLDPGQSAYNVPFAIRFKGLVNVGILEESFQELIHRHEVLRTTFSENNEGEPYQVVAAGQAFQLPVTDLQTLSDETREDEARQLVTEYSRLPFNLQRGPLFRVNLLRLADDEHILSVVLHHTIVDGWSLGILAREISTLYEAFLQGKPSPLPDIPIQYGDYATWQRDWMQGEYLAKLLAYWTSQLKGAPPILELPTDFPRPAIQTHEGGLETLFLSEGLLDRLQKLAFAERCTLFMVLLAAFNVLLSRYSGQEDIVIGTPLAGRNRSEVEGLIGLFVNTLALRTDLTGSPSFRELLCRVREVTLGAYGHQDLPFEKLVEEMRPDRQLSHPPIFQAMLAFQNVPKSAMHLPGLTLSTLEVTSGTAKVDLMLSAQTAPNGIRLGMTYNVALFQPATVRRMLAHFENLLESIVANPQQCVSALPMLCEAERSQLLYGWNQTQEYPAEVCIHQLFEQQVKCVPRKVALVFEGQTISYAELNARSNQLARYLKRMGVGPDVLVGLCMERSLEMVVGILGIVKAGGAYLPLDPRYPKDRLAFMVEDARPPVVLTKHELKELFLDLNGQVVALDADWAEIECEQATDLACEARPENLAYVIYTSGSTGRPKGCQITHANVVRLFQATQHWYGFNEHDVWTMFHSYAFDFSVWELWGALIYGGRLVVVPYLVSRSPEEFYRLLESEKVTVLNQTPSSFRQLMQAEEMLGTSSGLSLRYVIFGGEALEMQSLRPWFERHGDQKPLLVNMYGITETTVHVTYRPLSVADSASGSVIGCPIPDLQVYLLDRHLQPAPIGVPGEMYVGGPGVARGYLNRPELNGERFIPDVFRPGSNHRLYKSGDLARRLANGDIEYLGRIDNQIKLRGFRIELGEIESALTSHPSVRQAVVMLREDTPGDQRLVAYTVHDSDQPSTEELRAHLKHGLPEYMVPAAFVVLPCLPLTSNGKVDRRALPAPDYAAQASGARIDPRNKDEELLVGIWQKVLNLSSIGVRDNFFELGGHSLLAVRLLAEIRNTIGKEIPLAALFQGATIEFLATLLRDEESIVSTDMVVEVQGRGSCPPFFAIVTPGANALGYVALARHLGETQPLYRIQGPGQRVKDRPYSPAEYEDLARNYIQAMKSIQPEGPYYFGGMCEGARIAFDMARQLEAAGEKVQLLAIFDTWVIENSQNRLLWYVYYYRQRLRGLRKLAPAQRVQILKTATLSTVRRLLRLGKPKRNLWPAAYWPGKTFVPSKYRGDITLFKIPKQPFYYVRDPLMGWASRTTGQVKIYGIAARHNLMLREPYVQNVAQKLRECLATLQEKSGSAFAEKSSGAAASATTTASKFHASAARVGVGHIPQVVTGPERQEMQPSHTRSQSDWSTEAVAWPLTIQQQRLWLLEQLEHSGAAFHMPTTLRLKGTLDRSALENAVASLMSRHPILSSRVEAETGEPFWTLTSPKSIFEFVNSDEVRRADREQHVRRFVTEAVEKKFDLQSGPVLRARLLQVAPDDHILVFVTHAIVCDSISRSLLLRDLTVLYQSLKEDDAPELPDLTVSYKSFAAAQQDYLNSDNFGHDLAYWKERLSGAGSGLELPADHARPSRPSFAGEHQHLVLGEHVVARLQEFAQSEGSTIPVVLFSLFICILYRYSGVEDMLVGWETTGRNAQTANAVGVFVNTLPMRTDLSGNPTFRELLKRVMLAQTEASEHDDLPFGSLVQNLQLHRDLSRNPLFQVLFAYRELPCNLPNFSEMHAILLPPPQAWEIFDLTMAVTPRQGALEAVFSYSTDLFAGATIQRFLRHYQTLLEAVLADPQKPVSSLSILPEDERQQVLVTWNDTAGTERIDRCIHQLFEQQVTRTPEAIAVQFQDRSLTYRELNMRANQLAHYLRKLGVVPDSRVGICVHRSPEMMVGLLGIMKAGGAYVPLDPTYPRERLEFMLEDGGAGVLITQESLLESLSSQQAKVVCMDRDWPGIAEESQENPDVKLDPADLSYVIFTSGSTGRPKGVQLEHRNVVNFINSVRRLFALHEHDTYLGVASMSFDASVLDFYLPLAVGARLVMVDGNTTRDGRALAETMRRTGVTAMHATPSTWRSLVDAGWTGDSKLKIFSGGEALPWDLAQELLPRCSGLWNLYGPTETAVYSAIHKIASDDGTVLVGRPVDNTQIYILDAHQQPAPIGVSGEICIAGAGVARGYLNRPELTADKFVADPFSKAPGARLYRTGDLGRFRPDGVIQCLGRVDHQVKLRGFRIELGEIESVLTQHPAVQQAVVIVREDTPGDKRLIGYLIGKKDSTLDPHDVRTFLKRKLPDYMVPGKFMILESLPLTPNGKVNRKGLPEPKAEITDSTHAVPPRDELEAGLVRIFEQVLGIQPVGINEDFFDLGGHSLMAARMIAGIRHLTQKDLPLSVLFQGANVEYLAKVLRNGVPSLSHQTVMQIQRGESDIPFFAVVSPGESALGYAVLARHMGSEHTVYTLQGAGPIINQSERPYTPAEMDSLANEYVAAMRTVQPTGPYYFGGMCDGAHIALRIAQVLENRGESVGMLAIFDTWVLEHSLRRFPWLIHYWSERFGEFRARTIREQTRILSRTVGNLLLRTLGLQKKRSLWSETYWPNPEFVPPSFDGSVTLFKRPNQPHYYVQDEDMGWGTRAKAGVEVHVLPIHHSEMLREPHVQVLAKHLSECLREKWSCAESGSRQEGLILEPTSSGAGYETA